ncbi:hypothetical protein J6590_090212 [Homalodisca vitripennis]|nr:hypothetical protein J6590_090212 [Homalodisca vitripennis]
MQVAEAVRAFPYSLWLDLYVLANRKKYRAPDWRLIYPRECSIRDADNSKAELQACVAVRDELALKINVTLKPLFCGKPRSTLDCEVWYNTYDRQLKLAKETF